MRSGIQAIVDKFIDKLKVTKNVDLMRDFAFPIPSAVICWIVGVPEEDWPKFSQRTANGSRALEPAPLNPLELAQQNKSVSELREYFNSLVELRHREPKEDLISIYCAAEREGKITRIEVLDNLRMNFIGGQETTVNTIGNGLLALFKNLEQLALLCADMSRLTDAVTEIIRYDASVQITPADRCHLGADRLHRPQRAPDQPPHEQRQHQGHDGHGDRERRRQDLRTVTHVVEAGPDM